MGLRIHGGPRLYTFAVPFRKPVGAAGEQEDEMVRYILNVYLLCLALGVTFSLAEYFMPLAAGSNLVLGVDVIASLLAGYLAGFQGGRLSCSSGQSASLMEDKNEAFVDMP